MDIYGVFAKVFTKINLSAARMIESDPKQTSTEKWIEVINFYSAILVLLILFFLILMYERNSA